MDNRFISIRTPGFWPLPPFLKVHVQSSGHWLALWPVELEEKSARYIFFSKKPPGPLVILEAELCKALPKKIIIMLGPRRIVLSRWIGGLYSNLRPRTLSQVRAFYDAIAPLYTWHTEPTRADQLKAFVPFLPSKAKVLDASAGDCRFAQASGKRFDLWCADISPKMLALRPKTIPLSKAIVSSASKLPFPPSSFDAVVHTFANTHALDRGFFKSFYRVLRPGGLLLYHPVKAAGEQWPQDFENKTRQALQRAGFSSIERKAAYASGKKKTTLVFYLAYKSV